MKILDTMKKVVKNKMPGLFTNRTQVSWWQREYRIPAPLNISTNIYGYVLLNATVMANGFAGTAFQRIVDENKTSRSV